MDNTYEQSTDSTFGNKPTMNVFIPTDEIINGDKVYRKKLKNGKYITSGFLWDIWTSIKKKYENKYEIIETFGYDKKAKYSTFISDTKKSKYDLVIAPFVHTANREKIINFSLPIYVDSLSISYSKKTTIFDDFKNVLYKSGKLLLGLIVLGIISGILLTVFDKKRGKWLPQIKNNKNKFAHPMRNFITGFAAVVGEMGYLAENTGLTISGLTLSIILMIFSFITVMLVQAQFTRLLIDTKHDSYNFDKPLLSLQGYAAANKIKNYGGVIISKPGHDIYDMIKEYNNNVDKYGGIVLLYGHMSPYTNLIKNYKVNLNYGHELCSFIVNEKRNDILEDINIEITRLKNSGNLKHICNKHFTGNLKPLCSLN